MDEIIRIADNKIKIIHCNYSDDRKKLHTYFQERYPEIGKASLRCDIFDEGDSPIRFYRCPHCDHRKVYMRYSYGTLDNNKDEYYHGICPKCDESVYYEPNYDIYESEDHMVINGNNIFVWGKYFHGYNRGENNISISDEDINKIFNKYNIYEIDAPKNLINKRKMGDYIETHINI